ncbi:MAG TPA: hypothetical protein VMT79_21180 [Candidatus Binatia bacterium]|nr:hypothetical protein [Candidatus Binatia bacterium]
MAGPRAGRAASGDGATLIRRYAAEIDDPWAVCHGLRGMGREFTVKGGRPAVDFLLETQLTSAPVNGRPVLAFPIQVEVHPNSFLKTMLEAGVPLDHAFTHQGTQRTLREVVDGARALFRPKQIARQASKPQRANAVPWSIIAFARTTSPLRPRWTNAWDEPVELDPVVEDALRLLEDGSQPLMDAMRQGKAESTKAMVHDYTCGGTHLIYALLAAIHAGYTGRDRVERMQRQVDLLVWRMKADIDLIGRFYQQRASHPGRYWFELDSKLKLLGHGEECLALGTGRGVVALSPAQQAQRRTAVASIRQMLDDMEGRNVREARGFDVDLYRQLVGDACHARHGLTLA